MGNKINKITVKKKDFVKKKKVEAQTFNKSKEDIPSEKSPEPEKLIETKSPEPEKHFETLTTVTKVEDPKTINSDPPSMILPQRFHKNLYDFYELFEEIGKEGMFGVARIVKEKETQNRFAVKIMDKSIIPSDHFDSIAREVELMESIPPNPYVISFKEACEDVSNIYIIMELCEGGELFEQISSNKQYSEKDAAKVIHSIVSALLHLHENNICHADVKPDNFLFKTKDKDSLLKIIDFGMSQKDVFRHYHTNPVGTPYYVAPEVLLGEYNKSSDIWSVGVIMFVLLFGYPPFHPSNQHDDLEEDEQILAAVLEGFTPELKKGYGPWFPVKLPVSASARDLISKTLVNDISKRYTAEEIISHPWIKDNYNDTSEKEPLSPLVRNSLLFFNKQNKFKEAVLLILSDEMDDSLVKAINDQFKFIDKNKDGLISVSELQSALHKGKQKGGENKNVWNIISECDLDDDFHISYQELLAAVCSRSLSNNYDRLKKAFARIDKNKDGRITKNELVEAMETSGISFEKGSLENLLSEADLNQDGVIDREEFMIAFGEMKKAPWDQKVLKRMERSESVLKSKKTEIVLSKKKEEKSEEIKDDNINPWEFWNRRS